MSDEKTLSILDAWRKFHETELPKVWADLTEADKNEIKVANQTAAGAITRKTRKGDVRTVQLGEDRVARLLAKFAPGKFELVRVEPYFIYKEEGGAVE